MMVMIHTSGELLTIDVGERTWETTDIDDLLKTYIGDEELRLDWRTIESPSTQTRSGPKTVFTFPPVRCRCPR